MSPVPAALVFCVWLLGTGLLAVYFQVETVYSGVRAEKLLREEADLLDRLRRQEMRYNHLVSPDLLEDALAEVPAEWEEFVGYDYPIPAEEDEVSGIAVEGGSSPPNTEGRLALGAERSEPRGGRRSGR